MNDALNKHTTSAGDGNGFKPYPATDAGCQAQRPETVREALTRERENCLARAQNIKNRIDRLDSQFGKSLLEMPRVDFQQLFDSTGYMY